MLHNRKRKVPEIQVFKGLALLAVIFQSSISSVFHNNELPVETSIMLGLLYNLAKYSAPAFIFVTGFVLLYNQYQPARYFDFIKTKAIDLLFPYVVWTFVYFALADTFPFFSSGWLSGFGEVIITGDAAAHLWYVVMVFQFFLFYPLILTAIKKLQAAVASVSQLVILFSGLALTYISLLWGYQAFIAADSVRSASVLHYADRSLLAYFIYFAAGSIAALYLVQWRKFVKRMTPFAALLFVIFFIWIGDELLSFKGVAALDISATTYLKPSMFFYIMTELLLLYALASALVRTRSILYYAVNFFGQFSYGAYLSHLLFLGGVSSILQALQLEINAYLQGSLVFLFTSFFSIAFAFLISGIPYGKFVIGHFEKMQIHWERLIPAHTELYKIKK